MNLSKWMVLGISVALSCSLAMGADKKKAGDAEKGKEVFSNNAESAITQTARKRKWGRASKGLFSNEKMNNGKKPNEANVREKIDEGGNGMPSYKEMLSDDEKERPDRLLEDAVEGEADGLPSTSLLPGGDGALEVVGIILRRVVVLRSHGISVLVQFHLGFGLLPAVSAASHPRPG